MDGGEIADGSGLSERTENTAIPITLPSNLRSPGVCGVGGLFIRAVCLNIDLGFGHTLNTAWSCKIKKENVVRFNGDQLHNQYVSTV